MMLFADPLFGLPSWIDAIVRILIIVLAMTVVVMYLTYGERKVVARFQQRLGPTETGPAGLIQAIADAIKLVLKEDIRPTNADRWVLRLRLSDVHPGAHDPLAMPSMPLGRARLVLACSLFASLGRTCRHLRAASARK